MMRIHVVPLPGERYGLAIEWPSVTGGFSGVAADVAKNLRAAVPAAEFVMLVPERVEVVAP